MRAIGVVIGGVGVTGGIVIGGQAEPLIVREQRYHLSPRTRPALRNEVPRGPRIEATLRVIESLLSELPRTEMSSIEAIGIASPGVIDSSSGIVLDEPAPGYALTNWPLELSRKYKNQFAFYVQNDAKAAAWGEYLFWHLRSARAPGTDSLRPASLIHVIVDYGIGSGIVTGGVLLLGAHYVAGEFGSLPAVGNVRGRSLEEVAAWDGLLKATGLTKIRDVIERAQGPGNQGSLENDPALHDAAQALGLGVASLANIVGPEVVTLGGAVIENVKGYFAVAAKTAQDHLNAPDQNVLFSRATLGDQAQIIGVAHLALQYGRSAASQLNTRGSL